MITSEKGPLFGVLILALVACQAGAEVTQATVFRFGVVGCLLGLVAVMLLTARAVGRIFLIVSAATTLTLIALEPGWQAAIWKALLTSGFFVAFFSALTALRNASGGSPSMERAGDYLARQPPGRRYLALTAGAQAFAVLLNYGAIQLLGTLAVNSAKSEPDETIRKIRIRRMLLAIHRGFASSLSWSPLSFSIAISVAVIPGTSWGSIAVPGLVTSAIILLTGWAVDTIFKPQVAGRRPQPTGSPGRWTALFPLLVLLALVLGLLVGLAYLLPIRVVGLVLMIVPAVSFVWVLLQPAAPGGLKKRFRSYVTEEIPGYRAEILLIATAGYIGSTASVLVAPHIGASGIDLTALPVWVLLLGLVWIMPVLGQLGANPILSMSLVGPLLPPAEILGISPVALAVALICGWTLTGITSPFTATNLLIGRFGGVRPIAVGWVWNRSYFVITMALLCLWTLIYAFVVA
ncbi:hypothetical protein [Antarctobacter sp.]|uniref:hypothetical protein n=1 Tax=Antarctobacter sp. TaxID=1872577 RepID=UPI003A8EFC5E